jgi:hypothetical protein
MTTWEWLELGFYAGVLLVLLAGTLARVWGWI